MGTLYIVPTPIGNLEDITLRALRILKSVMLIAAEDTRTSGVLLKHYEIETPLTSYHAHNKLSKLDELLEALAMGDVALISDAGMPSISDPGYELICAAIDKGHRIEPLPGANAALVALVGSGLPIDSFIYLGFLPKKASARRQLLQSLQAEKRTLVAYESPNRLCDTLSDILAVLGQRTVCVARELTKLYEEFQRGDVEAVLMHYRHNPPKGEITLVIGGASEPEIWDEERVRAALQQRLAAGERLSQAAKAIAAESGWKKKAVYNLGIKEP